MIYKNVKGLYVPGSPIARGLVHCGAWQGKIVWILVAICTAGIAGYGIMMRFDAYSGGGAPVMKA